MNQDCQVWYWSVSLIHSGRERSWIAANLATLEMSTVESVCMGVCEWETECEYACTYGYVWFRGPPPSVRWALLPHTQRLVQLDMISWVELCFCVQAGQSSWPKWLKGQGHKIVLSTFGVSVRWFLSTNGCQINGKNWIHERIMCCGLCSHQISTQQTPMGDFWTVLGSAFHLYDQNKNISLVLKLHMTWQE